MAYINERSGTVIGLCCLLVNCGRASVVGISGRLYAVHVGGEWDGMIVTQPLQRQPKTANMKVEYFIWIALKLRTISSWPRLACYNIITLQERRNQARTQPSSAPYSCNISPMAV